MITIFETIEVKIDRERANSRLERIHPLSYKFHDGNVGDPEKGILRLPLYMVMYI